MTFDHLGEIRPNSVEIDQVDGNRSLIVIRTLLDDAEHFVRPHRRALDNENLGDDPSDGDCHVVQHLHALDEHDRLPGADEVTR